MARRFASVAAAESRPGSPPRSSRYESRTYRTACTERSLRNRDASLPTILPL